MEELGSPGGSNVSTGGSNSNRNRKKKRCEMLTTTSSSSGEASEAQALMEQRQKRRKESNRESARRSRMRKQLHLDGMAAQVARLRAENYRMALMLERAMAGLLTVETENSVLRTQAVELQSRLRSLDDISAMAAAANWGIMPFYAYEYVDAVCASLPAPAPAVPVPVHLI